MHKIYLNYQFAMEGSSQKSIFLLKKTMMVLVFSMIMVSRYQLLRVDLREGRLKWLYHLQQTQIPLCMTVSNSKNRLVKRERTIWLLTAKNFIDLTSKWFRGSNSIYGDWNTDKFAQKEVHELLCCIQKCVQSMG